MFFDFKHVKGDIFGGITAGIVALPLALAFGVQSGMGAIAGLYGAMMLGCFAAILGGTATQISGPTGPMTVVSATVIAAAIEITGSLQAGMGIIIAIFLLAGGFQIVFSLLKIGKYIKYIPYPVLSGFMTGIGIIIILFQIYPFMGHKSAKTTIDILMDFGRPLSALNLPAIGLGGGTIGIIYLFPKITKVVPSALVALLAATLTAYFMKLDVPLIGDIPSGIPSLKIWSIFSTASSMTWTVAAPDLAPLSYVSYVVPELSGTGGLFSIDASMTWMIIQFAATIAALGAIDSLLTSVIADNITKTKHNSHRELMGQGIGNVASALIGGLPGAGATMRTIVNVNAGGKTRLSGLIHGLLLFGILVGLGKYASYIPMCVLAGILITVGIGIVDYHKGLRHLFYVPRADTVILIIVMAITVFGNLIHAVGVGVVLACVLFMKKASDLAERGTTVTPLGSSKEAELWDDGKSIYDEYKDKIYIKHMSGPMFFGFTSRFQELMKELDPGIKVLIIRMKSVPYIDQSGVYVLEESILELRMKGVLVLMTGVQPQPLDMMKKLDIIPSLVSKEFLFEKFSDCELWLKYNLKSKSESLKKL
ncbi:MAG: SulP family inorganic anion transporter [Planctomycetes bacterium]|nr:SulP family inorganic anion transporter [Planctomycetota bacterium]